MHCDAPLKYGTIGDWPRLPMPGTNPDQILEVLPHDLILDLRLHRTKHFINVDFQYGLQAENLHANLIYL